MLCTICKANEVGARAKPGTDFCEFCFYSGAADERQRSEQVAKFRAAFPDAEYVGIEHTGGGCFWLALRWADDPKFYAATDANGGLPSDDDGHALTGRWGLVCRNDYTEDESNEDYEGTLLVGSDDDLLSDDEVIDAIRADRAARVAAAA